MIKRLLLLLILVPATFGWANEQPIVLVSIPPLAYFAKALVGDQANIEVLVPAGANPHSYAPTPKQVSQLSDVLVWFRLGELAENRVVGALKGANPDIEIVNLCRIIPPSVEMPNPCQHEGRDPHIWLSARMGEKVAEGMATALRPLLPDHAAVDAALSRLVDQLRKLDHQLGEKLAPYKGSTILVSHPAFGYFCHDYGLDQLSVEVHGKEPSPRQLTGLVESARQADVEVVILLKQWNNKGAVQLARLLNLSTCTVDPLAENVPQTLEQLTNCITRDPPRH